MAFLRALTDWFASVYTISIAAYLLAAGAVSVFVDAPELKKKGLERDRKAALTVGLAAIVLAPTLWVLVYLVAPR